MNKTNYINKATILSCSILVSQFCFSFTFLCSFFNSVSDLLSRLLHIVYTYPLLISTLISPMYYLKSYLVILVTQSFNFNEISFNFNEIETMNNCLYFLQFYIIFFPLLYCSIPVHLNLMLALLCSTTFFVFFSYLIVPPSDSYTISTYV